MKKSNSYAIKIDNAFSLLIMSNNIIEIISADCDNELAADLACSLVAKLIKSAIDELSPTEHFFSPLAEKTKLKFHIVASGNSESPIYKFPPFDVDERITAMLRELMVK